MNNISPESLIGPQAEDRIPRENLAETQLADGTPLYHLFLDDSDALSLSAFEAEQAKNTLAEWIAEKPDMIRACAGKSMEEAKELLFGAKRAAA